MDKRMAEALRAVGERDQTDALTSGLVEEWEVKPYVATTLTSLALHLGRVPTEQETEELVEWVIETIVRSKLLDGAMLTRWGIVGVRNGKPMFGEFRLGKGGSDGEGNGDVPT